MAKEKQSVPKCADVSSQGSGKTMLQQAEEKIRNEHAMLERTEAIAHVGSWEWDIATDTVTWSEELFRIFQRDPREGAPSFAEHPSLYHPDDMARLQQAVEAAVAKGNPYELELRAIRKDGETRICVARGIAEIGPGGRAVHLFGSLQDITERKRAEEELRESEERFRTMFRGHDAIMLLIDQKTGAIRDANLSATRFYGYSIEQLCQMTIQEINTLPAEEVAHQRTLAITEKRNYFIFPHRLASGEVKTVEVHSSPIITGKETILFSIIHDITERKKSDDELRLSKQQLELTLQYSGAGVWNWDIICQRLEWSRELFALFGLDPDRDEATFDSWNKVIHPDDLENAHHRIENAINQKIYLRNEYRIILPNGELRWISALGDTQYDDSGKPVHMSGICINITERKQHEEKLKETLESLRKAVGTTIQVMASAVEIRDPYTAGHQIRSAGLARAIATEMGLSPDKIEGIRIAASIHDIGKLSIPSEILSKPTKLSKIEFSLIKEHAQHGYEILKNIESPWPLAEIVYQHHELIDGSGYPRKLKGNDILIEARILMVADVVEAMASHRPYRPALGIDAALEEIEKNSGTLYDEAVVDACLRLFREKGFKLEHPESFETEKP